MYALFATTLLVKLWPVLWRSRGSSYKVLAVSCIGLSWIAAFVMQSVVDLSYSCIIWSEQPPGNDLFPDGRKYSGLHSVFRYPELDWTVSLMMVINYRT